MGNIANQLAFYWCNNQQSVQVLWNTDEPQAQNSAVMQGKIGKVLLQHNSVCPHTSHKTCDILTSLPFTVLPHPPCSPDLAPYDYVLFENIKNAHYAVSDFNLKKHSRQPSRSGITTHCKAIQMLPKRWQKNGWASNCFVFSLNIIQ
jgi:hypothetical protein